MLFLLFQLGQDRYAIEAARVAEVVPVVHLKKMPRAAAGVAGLFSYRGTSVPVIDASELSLGRPAPRRFSTRIVLLNYEVSPTQTALLGLLVEKVTETIRLERSAFVSSGVEVSDAPYLGPVARDSRGIIQWIQLDLLLPQALRDLLFCQPVEHT